MKNFLACLLAVPAIASLLVLSACSPAQRARVTEAVQQTEIPAQPTPAATASTGAATVAEVLAEKSPPHDQKPVDTAAPATGETVITLDDSSISASGAGITIDGSRATINAPGTYRVHGKLTNGQLAVNTTDKGPVTVILSGVDIVNARGPAIDIVKADSVVLTIDAGTQNSVTDGASYAFETDGATEPNAAIFSKADLTIDGAGALAVRGNFNDGIASKDGLVIAGPAITVNAADDAIRGKNYLVVHDGTLDITAKGDGLKSDHAEDPKKGYIAIDKGEITVVAGGDGIAAQTDVLIKSGNFAITAGGGADVAKSDTQSAKGIKAGVHLAIDGGTFKISAADDALHSNDALTINNGQFELASADDGAHAENALRINNGVLRVTRSYEGIESRVITINGGDIQVTSSDDGVNVADGTQGGPGGSSRNTSNKFLYMNGGTIAVTSGGDGIDSNGAIEMTGGTMLVHGPVERFNAALDFDGGFQISGGVVVAAGSAGMAQSPGPESQQRSVMVFFDTTQPAGTLVHVRDSSGKALLTFAPLNDFQTLAFSSPALAQGGTYEVLTGGSATGTSSNGIYGADSTYSSGTVFKGFTVSEIVTTVGTNTNRRRRP